MPDESNLHGEDYCVNRKRIQRLGRDERLRVLYPGSPWQNAWIESFNGRLRDEHLNGQLFDIPLEAKVLTELWRIGYNSNRRHSGIGRMTPAAFAEAWTINNQLQLA